MKRLGSLALYLYTVICGLWIYAWPRNKYEWMLHDNEGGEAPDFCGLPIDEGAAMAPLIASLPLLLLAALACYLSVKHHKVHPSLLLTLIVALAWALKFFILIPHCS